MAGRKRFVMRDDSGNQFVGSSIERALREMPEQARDGIANAAGDPPDELSDLWTSQIDAKPNLERVYHV